MPSHVSPILARLVQMGNTHFKPGYILNDARKAKKQNMLMQRILTEGEGRFSTINLLIKIGCFVKKLNLKSS